MVEKTDQILNVYMFPQQRDSTCMLMPFYHLDIIRQQQNTDGALRHFDREWHTKLEWLVKTFPGIRDWHLAMGKLTFPKEGEKNDFADFQKDALFNGIAQEMVEDMQHADGTPYIQDESLASIIKMYLTPYTVNEKNKFHMLTKTVPVYYDKGAFYCFDPSKKEFIPLEARITNLPENFQPVSDLNIPESIKSYYQLEDNMVLFVLPSGFGKDNMFKASYIDKNFRMLGNQKAGYFYGQGLYMLMLFAMGVDNKNQSIVPGHPLYDAYQNFREEMDKSTENPWASPHFKKENLLEYHVAEILRKNPELKEKFKKTISQLTAWRQYQALDTLFYQGSSLKDKKQKYLPGEEQMLAYAISQNLKYLWASSLSVEKFKAVLDLDDLSPEELEGIDFKEIAALIKQEAEKKGTNEKSFLDLWEDLRGNVQARAGGEHCSLVSFDGHGSVKCFSPKAINYQTQKGLADEAIFSRLGYTEVDSYYQEGRQPFYQRTPEETQKMKKAASAIQSAWRAHKSKKGGTLMGGVTKDKYPSKSLGAGQKPKSSK